MTMTTRPIPTSASSTPVPRFRLGTRGSALAMAQSTTIAEALRALGAEVELVTVQTLGDDRPPDTAWGEGAFVGALEAAVMGGQVDLAVHSAKDVPTTEDPRLTIAAYPLRADPHDALIGREPGTTLQNLPRGARVGTDSPRRSAFLRVARPDLHVHPLHGNVDTRLRRLDQGETDALVLAVAGLARLGLMDRIGQILPAELVPPAPGQGSLALQCRADDDVTRSWLAHLDHDTTRIAVEAERAFLQATGGGCRAPIGALGHVVGDQITLHAGTAGTQAQRTPQGDRPTVAWGEVHGHVRDRMALAAELASRLTAELVDLSTAATAADNSALGPWVLITRPAAQSGSLITAMEARGLRPMAIPTIETQAVGPGGELDAAILRIIDQGWIAVTSANGASAVLDAAARLGADITQLRWAAVGPVTKDVLEARGVTVSFVPNRPDATALGAQLPIGPGDTVLLPRADIADGRLVAALEARGARVDAVVAYRTIEAPETSRERLRALFATGNVGAIVFTSGSSVRGLLELLGSAHRRIARGTAACCLGEPTATVARALHFERVLVAPTGSAQDLVDVTSDALTARLSRSLSELSQEDHP